MEITKKNKKDYDCLPIYRSIISLTNVLYTYYKNMERDLKHEYNGLLITPLLTSVVDLKECYVAEDNSRKLDILNGMKRKIMSVETLCKVAFELKQISLTQYTNISCEFGDILRQLYGWENKLKTRI